MQAKAVLLPSAAEPLPVLLMNTLWADRAGVHDGIARVDELRAWMRALATRLPDGAAVGPVRAADVVAFGQLRSALRQLAAHQTGDPRDRITQSDTAGHVEDAVAYLNAAAIAAPPQPKLLWPQQRITYMAPAESSGATAALSSVAAEAIALFGESAKSSLRACLAPGCVLYFVKDHPRREWCSDACGNRARAARHYARHRPTR